MRLCPSRDEAEPLAATGTDGLPDDIPALKQIIRDLNRRVDVAERRAQDAEHKAAMLSQVRARPPASCRTRRSGRSASPPLPSRIGSPICSRRGMQEERGLHAITLKSVAEAAGVSDDAASKHIGKLVDAGVLRKEVRWIPSGIDPETGEITNGHKRQYIGPVKWNVIDFVEAVASLQPEKPKTWGGRVDRCRPCTGAPRRRRCQARHVPLRRMRQEARPAS